MATIGKPPTRVQLERIAGQDQELIKALERLFDQALKLTPTEFAQLQEQVAQDTAAILANTNGVAANLASITNLSDGTTGITPNLLTGWEVGGVPITVTASEINRLAGVTSDVQTQLDAKADENPLTQIEVEDAASTVFGEVSGERLSQAVVANVGAANAGLAFQALGTYVLARDSSGSATFPGNIVAGSSLNPCNTSGTSVGAALSGTWQCMGRTPTGTGSVNDITLWLKVT